MEYKNIDISLQLERLLEGRLDKVDKATIFFNSLKEYGKRYELNNAEIFRSAGVNRNERLKLNIFINNANECNKNQDKSTFNTFINENWEELKDMIKNVSININDFLSKIDISNNDEEVVDTIRAIPKVKKNRNR
jgi:hypothetical protein